MSLLSFDVDFNRPHDSLRLRLRQCVDILFYPFLRGLPATAGADNVRGCEEIFGTYSYGYITLGFSVLQHRHGFKRHPILCWMRTLRGQRLGRHTRLRVNMRICSGNDGLFWWMALSSPLKRQRSQP
jgi:hypothetical protein